MTFRYLPALLASVLISCGSGTEDVKDGFESNSLSEYWDDRKFLPGAIEMQGEVVRGGSLAARITLRPGDQIPQEKGTILERAEITESSMNWSMEDSLYEYTFSIFIPNDFPIDSTRLVIAQWKQECPVSSCVPDNPLIAIRFVSGQLSITHLGPDLKTLYKHMGEVRNQWLDFVFHISFSRQNGSIDSWLNGEKVVEYKGITAYPMEGGYPEQNQFYFKAGLYRDRSSETMTLFFDEYSKRLLHRYSGSR